VKKENQPFFSVIVPTYNRLKFLPHTIESILNQSFINFELILVDDGSTDKTPQIIPQKFEHDKRLRFFRKKNEERSVARNFGMQKAQGEYLLFFDSDDFMHPNHLEVLYQRIVQFSNYRFWTTKYQTKTQNQLELADHQHLKEGAYDYSFLLSGNILGVLICFKRLPLLQYLFLPEFNMCEDWIFNIQNLKNHKIYLIDEITITVSGHSERSLADNQKAITGRIQAMDYLLENVNFTSQEKALLQGHSYRFCAIHAYLENDLKLGFRFWRKMISFLGFQPSSLVLLLKIFIGKKRISYLQNLLQK